MDDTSDNKSMPALWRTSLLAGGNAPYLEALYEGYLQDPAAIDPSWRAYFDGLARVNGAHEVSHVLIRDAFRQQALQRARPVMAAAGANIEQERKQVRVLQLINAYRFRGTRKRPSIRSRPRPRQKYPNFIWNTMGYLSPIWIRRSIPAP